MNYIVMDLEWNQSSTVSVEESSDIPFEIIEIGAVKLRDDFTAADEYGRLIKPVVYPRINHITGKLIGLATKDFRNQQHFPEVVNEFLDWCGTEEYTFCIWGGQDLTEMQRNLLYHKMEPLARGPIAYMDIQKMFSLAYEDGESRRSLELAIDMMELEKDRAFHRAYNDAYYTAKILKRIAAEHPDVLKRVSFDVFFPPANRKAEIKMQFDTHMKYISRGFETRLDAFADREVASSKCYICHHNLRKKIKWFSINGKHYYCLAYCPEHGYLGGKIRVRKSADGQVFVVKTTKLLSESEVQEIRDRSERAKELKRKHAANKAQTPQED